MVDLLNIRHYTTARPAGWTLLGTEAEFDALPPTHQAQVLFLDPQASAYIHQFLDAAGLVTGGLWEPFAQGNFRDVATFSDFRRTDESRQALKKWLYRRGLPFGTWVFVLSNNDHPLLMTWKMLIKYADRMFTIDDVVVFDPTQLWCLVFFHEDQLFFGKDKVYDPAGDEARMRALNEKKRRFPHFRHPYL